MSKECFLYVQEHTRQSQRRKRKVADEGPTPKRKYTVFPGRNSFYCWGHLVMAQKAGTFYLTLFLVVGTSVTSFAFDARYLAEEVSLKLRQNYGRTNVFQLLDFD